MALNSLNMARIWQMVPERHPITLYSRTPGTDHFDAYQLPGDSGKVVIINKTEATPGGLILETRDSTITTWKYFLLRGKAPDPKKDDYFTLRDGTSWVIKSVKISKFGNEFECPCREMV